MAKFDAPGVYIEEKEAGSRPIQGVGTAVAGFVGRTPTGPAQPGPLLVTNWNQFKRTFGELTDGFTMTWSIYGFFQNGGGACYVSRIGAAADARARAQLPAADDATVTALEVAATGDGAISVEVPPAADGEDKDAYEIVVRRDQQEVARFASTDLKRSTKGALVPATAEAAPVELTEVTKGRRPAPGVYDLTVPSQGRLTAKDFVGDDDARSGLAGLAAVDEITMLVAPDLMAPPNGGAPDLNLAKTVQGGMVSQCDAFHDRMAILDPPPLQTPQQVLEWKSGAGLDSEFAAIYYPWLGVYDPTGGQPRFLPPSGHMAGIWSRSDAQRGVHKAPANEPVSGVVDLATQVTRTEQGLMNPVGINVVRAFPGSGIRVWGARTATTTRREWQYVNVRRLFNYLEESIAEGTQWVVFEPNAPDLWQRIVRTIEAFLLVAWRDGALFGRKPEQAFYVRCDESTNPPEMIEQGRVTIEVGLAPVKPAEFVVFEVAQFPGGALVSE